jgi:hypothetical protein
VLAVLLAGAVVIPRSYLIGRAHSPTHDVPYHVTRGIAYLSRSIAAQDLWLNDPPMGEGLLALPVIALNAATGRDLGDDRIFDQPGRADAVVLWGAVWGALLFLPLVASVFAWCGRVYGLKSAWLAVGMLVVEPNLAALIPVTSPDLLGVTGIVVASLMTWRYFERPSRGRLAALGISIGAALMIKHTAVALAPLLALEAILWWVALPLRDGDGWAAVRAALPSRLASFVKLGLVVGLTIWILTLFELCPPKSPAAPRATVNAGVAPGSREKVARLESALRLTSPWPAGSYLRAFRSGFGHGAAGHPGYLFGELRETGWWYYFPAVSTYKIPVGVGVVFLLGLLSLYRSPPRWMEWGLFMPAAVWALFMMTAKINIGFRHFVPAYVFAMMLASRCVAPGARWWSAGAWAAVAAAAFHGASYHPDYLSYVNFARDRPYLQISDSNFDWGQDSSN